MRTAAIAAALALLVAGCGDEQESEQPAQTNDAFPVSIEHKFGTTTVEQTPKRVVTVGFNDQDFALALGVKPVGVRQFQGGIDITKRPWAQHQLNGAQPQIIGAEELEFEKIAALRPDLILAVYSGLSKRDYGTLSKIAPTVAQSDQYPDYGVPWEEQAEVSSRALGRAQQGDEVVDDVESEIAGVRREHPEFEGSSLVLASASAGSIYVFGPQDLRTRAAALMDESKYSATDVAHDMLRFAAGGRTYIPLPATARVLWRIKRWMPNIFLRLVTSFRERAAAAAGEQRVGASETRPLR